MLSAYTPAPKKKKRINRTYQDHTDCSQKKGLTPLYMNNIDCGVVHFRSVQIVLPLLENSLTYFIWKIRNKRFVPLTSYIVIILNVFL